MTFLSHQDALNEIAERIDEGNPMSTQELIDLAKNDLDVSVDGAKVKLGYSGSLTTSGNLYTGSLGLGIKSAFGTDVGILDQTDFFTFINDTTYQTALRNSLDSSLSTAQKDALMAEMLWGEDLNHNRINSSSIVDAGSARFMQTGNQPIINLVENPRPGGVWSATEVDAQIHGSAPTIDGVSRTHYLDLYDDLVNNHGWSSQQALDAVTAKINANAYVNLKTNLSYTLTPEGQISSVSVPEKFWQGAPNMTGAVLSPDTAGLIHMSDTLSDFDFDRMQVIKSVASVIGDHADLIAKFGAAAAIGVGLYTLDEANDLLANGDKAGAGELLGEFFAETIGGLAAGAAGYYAAVAVTAMLIPAAPALVVGGLVIGATIAIGVGGALIAEKLWEIFSEVYPQANMAVGEILEWVNDTTLGIQLSIGEFFQSAMEAFRMAFFDPPAKGDPLVIDLDNDGYELIAAGSSEVYFDYNGDSIGERTGWVAPDDGFLALDKNSNGTIDDVGELFGNLTMTGFEELALHDETVNGGNADGVINSTDSVFADLRIWQDLNSNGITDSGELQTLAQWGITQISLTTTEVGQTIAGNELAREANFADGQAVDKSIGEVYFNIDFFDNDMVSGAGTVFGTDPDLLALPLSRGYGEVISLQKAMETDTTLRGLVEDLADFTVTANSAQALSDLVTDILFRWTGADQVSPDPNAPIDPRKVAAMEAFFAMDVDDLLDGRPLDSRMIAGMEAAWEQAHDMFAARLLLQGPLNSLVPNAIYDFVNDTMKLNASLAQIFNAFEASGWKSEAMSELLYDLLDITGAIDPNVPTPNEAYILFGDYDTSWIFPSPESIAGNLKAINGTGNADTLSGWAGGDVVHGGDGNDTLSTPSSSTAGWIINGVNTTTTYNATNYHHFMYGDSGADSITGAYGWVHLFGGAGNDRLISYVNDKGATLHGGADNDTVTGANTDDLLFGGTGDDSMSAGNGNDQLYGGEGHDTLSGGNGNNLLHGGAGNDVMSTNGGLSYMDGGAGNNSFTVTASEVTILAGAGDDTVSAGDFIGHSAIELGEGNNVVTRTGAVSPVGSVLVATGSGADAISIYASASTIESGAGNDTVYGGAGADSIVSGDGDDSVYTGSGNDTVISGAGNDVISIRGTVHVEAGTGSDTIDVEGPISGDSYIDLGSGSSVVFDSWSSNSVDYSITIEIIGGDDGNDIDLWRTNLDIVTGLGADTITAGGGSNYISAGGNNDTITVGNGSNTVYGGQGADVISSSSGNDLIYGGDGNDTITASSGSNSVYGGAGNDSVNAHGTIHIEAADGDDTVGISGTISGNSYVHLGNGINTILDANPSGGTINTQYITEIIGGDDANDIYFIRTAAYVTTGLADDDIHLGSANNSVSAGAGNDTIIAGSGNNTIYGGLGDDTISTWSGNDLIYGGDGDDTIEAGGGTNSIYGGAGNDNVNAHGTVHIETADGDDTVGISGTIVGNSYIHLGNGINTLIDVNPSGGTIYNQYITEIIGGDEANDIYFIRTSAYVTTGLANDDIQVGGGNNSVTAGAGNDTIVAGSGNNTVYGGSGDDTISSWAGSDLLYGGDGDDTIDAGSGLDTIDGGNGNNVITTGNSAKSISTGDGHDSISTGTGNDTIVSGSGNDTIVAGDGANIIDAGSGGNSITSGTGADSIVSGDGFDIVNASSGNNTIDGGAGNDSITSGNGTDLIYGGAGDDTIVASGGTKVLYSGDGNDTIDTYGLLSVDTGTGNDTITITGGIIAGNSSITLGIGKNILAQTGTVSLQASASMTITTGDEGDSVAYGRSKATITGGLGDDTITSGTGADSVVGGGGHDIINVSTGNNTVYGGAGTDSITAGSGADLIYGDDGNDTITGGGSDTIYGGDGMDSISVSGLLAIEAGAGDDTVTITAAVAAGNATIDLGAGKNVLSQTGTVSLLSTANMTITAGDEGDSITYGRSKAAITGGLGDDTISSGTGADSILGGAGNDIITTSGGTNTLDGGAGNDSITGGSGVDVIYGQGDVDTINGGSGNDTLDGGEGADSLDGGFGTDSVLGGAGNDTIAGGGTTSSDGADTLYGGDGHDSIFGGYGADRLFGDAGNDTLDGGTQNDTLSGGAGTDLLTGSSGNDYFSFTDLSHSTVTARDVITDFIQNQDKIDIAGLGFTGIQSGAASGTVLGYTSSGGVTVIEADGVDFSIQITGTIALLNTDFVF